MNLIWQIVTVISMLLILWITVRALYNTEETGRAQKDEAEKAMQFVAQVTVQQIEQEKRIRELEVWVHDAQAYTASMDSAQSEREKKEMERQWNNFWSYDGTRQDVTEAADNET